MYGQRYLPHMPAAGEVVIWDRSWYNRAGVERVMGFCTEEQATGFLEVIPMFEHLMVKSGIILHKYWLEVSPEEQTRRLEGRIDDRRKIWKLSPMDLKSYDRWGRLHQGTRRNVRCYRYLMGAVVCRPVGGQKAGAAERDQPPARARSVRGHQAGEGQAAETKDRPLQGRRLPVQVRAGEVLIALALAMTIFAHPLEKVKLVIANYQPVKLLNICPDKLKNQNLSPNSTLSD